MVTGNRFRELRDRLNFEQEELAESIGMGQKTWSNWENGILPNQIQWLFRLGRLYHVSADYLLGLSDDWRPPGSAGTVLTPEEDELITLWRSLTDDQRTFVLETLGKLRQWSQPRIIGSDDDD